MMELVTDEPTIDAEENDIEILKTSRQGRIHYPSAVRKKAYIFDGTGNYFTKEWDLSEGSGSEFCWYHVELPRENKKLTVCAKYLIDALCPPLKLQDILTLASNGPFCGNVNGALVFRVNSSGPALSKSTLRLAARVTENSVITVSLGRVPRLGFYQTGRSVLSDIPSVESPNYVGEDRATRSSGTVIKDHVLESFLQMNHFEECDNPVPKTISNLIVHILDTHMDNLEDIVVRLELDLDSVELELDKGDFSMKKQMLNERKIPKMNLDLQRLLQAVAHGEQVFPRVKEKCASKSWFASEDIASIDELTSRLRRLKENVGFIANRVTAIQAGLDSWQSEQINKKLYYLSFLSIIFLPLSIITGVFGMNVGGVPWTGQKNPAIKDGFRNVIIICIAMLFLLLFCFAFPSLYTLITTWRRRVVRRSFSLNRKSFKKRTINGSAYEGGSGYIRI